MVQIESTQYNRQTHSPLKSYKLLDVYTTDEQLNKENRQDKAIEYTIQLLKGNLLELRGSNYMHSITL